MLHIAINQPHCIFLNFSSISTILYNTPILLHFSVICLKIPVINSNNINKQIHLVYDMNSDLFKGMSLYNGQPTQRYSVPGATII